MSLDTAPIIDLLARIEAVPPPPPGLGQLMALDGLSPETKVRLQDLLTQYSDRTNLEAVARRDLAEAAASIEALVQHGYPAEPTGAADEAMLTELDARLDAMAAVRSRVKLQAD